MALQNSNVEILIPTVVVSGGGAFGRSLGHEGNALMCGMRALMKVILEGCPAPSAVTGHSEKPLSWTRKWALPS